MVNRMIKKYKLNSEVIKKSLITILVVLFTMFFIIGCNLESVDHILTILKADENGKIKDENYDGPYGNSSEQTDSGDDFTDTSTDEDTQQTNKIQKQDLIIDQEFIEKIKKCLLDEINDFQDVIDLSPCIQDYNIPETEVESLIDLVISIYEYEYMQNAFLFYLDGSMHAEYEMQSAWNERKLAGLKIKLSRYDRFEQASAADLTKVKRSLEKEAQNIASLPGNDRSDWEKLLIVHDELARRVSYDESLNQENNQAVSALLEGLSLCKGYAQAFNLICKQMEIECKVIFGNADGIEHAWNLVELDGKMYHVDVTHDDPIPDRGSKGPIDHRHFLRSDDVMRETHSWESELYQSASEDGAHYFFHNELVVNNQEELTEKMTKFFLLNDFYDDRADHLEVLYVGDGVILDDQIDDVFRQVFNESNINRHISYQLSNSKKVTQLIILPS